jgi:16S rRNA (cytidine1402-2'-O)-methyltransferase
VYFTQNEPRGEFTLVVAGKANIKEQAWTEDMLRTTIKSGLKLGKSPPSLAKRVAVQSGWNRKEIYSMIMEIKRHEP